MKKSTFKKIQIASLLLGLFLFVYVVHRTGLGVLAGYVAALGWGSLLILAISSMRNYLRSASWYFSISPEFRKISYSSLTNIMLAGEAIKYLTSTGPLLSEPAKAVMVKERLPLLHGFSSVVVENLIYYLSVVIFILAGLPALVFVVEAPSRLKIAGYVFAAAIVVGVVLVWISIRRRSFAMARFLGWLAGIGVKPAKLRSFAESVRSLEDNVYSFYEERRGAFYAITALNLGSHLLNIVEVYLILELMGLPVSIWASFAVEAVTKLINAAFFFVPTRAGVYESGNALVLAALGMSAGAGVALAIIRKCRAFVWVAYGLAVLGVTAAKRDGTKRLAA